MSGFPGRRLECSEYLNPLACRALRMSVSGLVFFDWIPAIMRLRVAASTTSAIHGFECPTLCSGVECFADYFEGEIMELIAAFLKQSVEDF